LSEDLAERGATMRLAELHAAMRDLLRAENLEVKEVPSTALPLWLTWLSVSKGTNIAPVPKEQRGEDLMEMS
jgi:hypothetical protein